ncbi:Uncharacterized protein APZ42_034023 [Daphnia magna]|uniref:Uncharacterized protein n=1 Tax=Daphnia magna TaxID=35525 RepID=A0A164KIN6_9CRUS|nr:Uncharacterized protein APZ42_034023 [Daphnia magna]
MLTRFEIEYASHTQYIRDFARDISNHLAREIRNLQCESRRAAYHAATTMAQYDSWLAASHLDLSLCTKLLAVGASVSVMQCSSQNDTFETVFTPCGTQPKIGNQTMYVEDWELTKYFKCYWPANFDNFNEKTHTFMNNTWAPVSPNWLQTFLLPSTDDRQDQNGGQAAWIPNPDEEDILYCADYSSDMKKFLCVTAYPDDDEDILYCADNPYDDEVMYFFSTHNSLGSDEEDLATACYVERTYSIPSQRDREYRCYTLEWEGSAHNPQDAMFGEDRGRKMLNSKERASIVAFAEADKSVRWIYSKLGVSDSTVVDWKKKANEDDMVSAVLTKPITTAQEIADVTQISVGPSTIIRVLKKQNIQPCRVAQNFLLSPAQAEQRLILAANYVTRQLEWWEDVIFSLMKNHLALTSAGGCLPIERTAPTSTPTISKLKMEAVEKQCTFGHGFHQVVRGFVRIEGKFNSQKYLQILGDILPHSIHARIIKQWFNDHQDEIELLPWPPKGANINPIENVCSDMDPAYTYAIDNAVNFYRQLEHQLNCFGKQHYQAEALNFQLS